MPLPVKTTGTVTSESEGRAPTLIDTLDSYAFINKNVYNTNGTKAATVKQVAKEFLQFCYTDESLAKFTEKSSVTKNLTYGSAATPDLSNATNFEESIWNVRSKGQCVTPVSSHVKFLNNPLTFDMTITRIWQSGNTTSPYAGFAEKGISVKDWFSGMKKTQTWWDNL